MTPALALDDSHIGWFWDPRINHDDASVNFGSGTPHEYLTSVNGRCHSGTSGSQADQAITVSATVDWPLRPLLSVLTQRQIERQLKRLESAARCGSPGGLTGNRPPCGLLRRGDGPSPLPTYCQGPASWDGPPLRPEVQT